MTHYDGPSFLKKQQSTKHKSQTSQRHSKPKEHGQLFEPLFSKKDQHVNENAEKKRVFNQRLHERQQSQLLVNQERRTHYETSFEYDKKFIEDDLMESSALLEGEYVEREQYDVPYQQRQQRESRVSQTYKNANKLSQVEEKENLKKEGTFTPTFIPTSEYVTGRVLTPSPTIQEEVVKLSEDDDRDIRELSKKLVKDKENYLLFEQGNENNDNN